MHIISLFSFLPLPLFCLSLCTKDPIPPVLLASVPVAPFYYEGETFQARCVNRNVAPFTGLTFWLDSANVPVGSGGGLEITNVTRSQAGVYKCYVTLDDTSVLVEVPSLSVTLVVYCKLY